MHGCDYVTILCLVCVSITGMVCRNGRPGGAIRELMIQRINGWLKFLILQVGSSVWNTCVCVCVFNVVGKEKKEEC